MPRRQLSVYEKNHLIKFGFNPDEIDQYGEMPVEYITGKAVFLGQTFTVTNATLIPRVETEELVELIQTDVQKNRQQLAKPLTVIDVGTGCGAIGLVMAQFFEQQQLLFRLIASDLSAEALIVAKKNFQALLPAPRHGSIEFLLSDLLTGLNEKQSVDLIFANVPYVPRERILMLASSVKDFEPIMALDGGEDGRQYISLLLKQATETLKPGGKVYLEVDDTHTRDKFEAFAKTYEFELLSDQFDKNRFGVFTLKRS